MVTEEFVRVINGVRRVDSILNGLGSCAFYLCLGSTATSDLEGISAAGATPALRRLTPAIDAEALLLGYPKTCDQLPLSPIGIVSPVVITRGCLQLAGVQPQVVNCGAFTAPQIPCIEAGNTAAQSVESGEAMPLDTVIRLFSLGFDFGLKEGSRHDSVTIAECVPGGTTTALGVLAGLGYDVYNSLSSSIPNCNHDARRQLVEQGLKKAGIPSKHTNPFDILAAVGDPMQPFVVGMALAACQSANVVLAGGSQMLAIYALCRALADEYSVDIVSAPLAVITTKWVAFDQNASMQALSEKIGAPFAASCPDFLRSRHPGLRAYEEGNVKEGVGAGAAMAIACGLTGLDSTEIMAAIDHSYDEMVNRFTVTI